MISDGANISLKSVGAYVDESRLLSRDSAEQVERRVYKKIHHVIANGDLLYWLKSL